MEHDFLIKQHPWTLLKETLKYPPVVSKFRPSDINPDIKVHDRSAQHTSNRGFKNVQLSKELQPKTKFKIKHAPKTPVQLALQLLGINPVAFGVKAAGRSLPFWKRDPEILWRLLELAKRRYELEISHAHPDTPGGGNFKRAAQLNSAWKLIKRYFSKHGYELH